MNDDTPLGEARDWLRRQVYRGATCPCCTQFVKVYRRTLPNATARVMIALWHRDEGQNFVFLPDVLDRMTGTPHQGGYGTLGQFWAWLQQQPGERADGSNRVGWWRLTDPGRSFVLGHHTVPRYAHLFNGRCLRLSGPPWSIRDALGTRFDYNQLMGRTP